MKKYLCEFIGTAVLVLFGCGTAVVTGGLTSGVGAGTFGVLTIDFFACFIEHDELEKVHTQLISIDANLKVEDYDKSIDEIEKCKFILKHIEEKDSLTIVNIF